MRRNYARLARVALLALAGVALVIGVAALAPVAEAAPQVIYVGCCNNLQWTIDNQANNGDVLILDYDTTYYECIYLWKKLTILGKKGSSINCDAWYPTVYIAPGGAGSKLQGIDIVHTNCCDEPAVAIDASKTKILTNMLTNCDCYEDNWALQIGNFWSSAPRKNNLVAGNVFLHVGGGIAVGDFFDDCCPVARETNRHSDNTVLNNIIAGPCCDSGYGGTVGDGIEVFSKNNQILYNVVLGADSEAFELDCPNNTFSDTGKCNSSPDRNNLVKNVFLDSDEDDIFFETNVKNTQNFVSNTFDSCSDDDSNNLCP